MKKLFASILLFVSFLGVKAQIITPKEHFGFNIGDDYHLANFSQTEAYFKKLAQQSDRILYQVIGKTEEGRDQPMLIVSSPENLAKLSHYKNISQRLARAELAEQEAKQLAKELRRCQRDTKTSCTISSAIPLSLVCWKEIASNFFQ